PNRTVKQLCADDSAATSVKVGYRQASYIEEPRPVIWVGLFAFNGHLFSAALPRFMLELVARAERDQ
ncbi:MULTISPECIES: hypothetical protein, partial [unclassified Duganella]|uniref:hypothetical protein n=1 Tax=unclassified Duganella TaxID=2636909 RepID=UPI001E36D583